MTPTAKTIRLAAELRAAGKSWELVARRMRRRVDVVSEWPEKFADTWRDAYEQARERVLADALAEAICVLRQQLRAEDEKIRLEAARKLVDRCGVPARESSDNRTSPLVRLATHLEGLSDVELQELLVEVRGRTPDHGNTDPDPAALPGGKA